MAIFIRPPYTLADSDADDEQLYLNRRALITGLATAGLLPSLASGVHAASSPALAGLSARRTHSLDEALTDYEDATHYNNFYEFSVSKEGPAQLAGALRTAPWTIQIGGKVKKPMTLDVHSLSRQFGLEERVYRLRCVEGWSMVIPWVGFPLAKLIALAEPLGSAKFLAFQTLKDPKQMPGQRSQVLRWPYVEGLRIDEARHPLTLLAVGMYGKVLPNQNGAPIRLVVPWKYGFKSIKSIVRIDFVERQPPTSWNLSAPQEYGFYSNVNPEVDHPRWSQKRERRIGDWLPRRTLPYNGYGEEVASLYHGMNLRRYF